MQLRIFTEPQEGASYDTLLRVARAAEDYGFDGFFRSDHYMKLDRGSGEPGPTDAWVTLAGLARETSRVRLGTLVTAATFRLPGPLAIAVAQVDQMSGGRIEFGLGTSWFEAEHRAYGVPFPAVGVRFDRYIEQLEIITGLWETPPGETYSFSGKHYTLVDSPALPKPAQRPRPPLIVGGSGLRRTPRVAARFADEFNAPFKTVDEARVRFDAVRTACAEAGRAEDSMRFSAALVVCCGRDDAELQRRAAAIDRDVAELRESGLAGSPAQIVEKIGRYGELGASRIYLQVLDLSDIAHIELLAKEVLPQVGQMAVAQPIVGRPVG